ncbi:PEP-CTERM sorting domain-containing protein [Glacieibacterium frigidum]|uniref:PEP-CTERM sorting domain-containing protein n=1 Tax=Glacieibacterium frigidum TaxID=2593303 RepID=A0A552UAV8_9SPHN|nr:PEP-CTERM sorting domain-containing protein [Glacieibacterium frigidum]
MDGFDTTTTRGINNFGTVVGFGQAIDADTGDLGPVTGLIWFFNGTGYDGFLLDSLVDLPAGYTTYAAQAINDAGQIVGFGDTPDGVQRGYLLSMVPEPATWALLIGGFGMVGTALRRRRALAA